MIINYLDTKLTLIRFRLMGHKPTIIRNNKWVSRGYSVGKSAKGNFIEVNNGMQVQYFTKANPFHNVYRIVSKNGNDFITHRVQS